MTLYTVTALTRWETDIMTVVERSPRGSSAMAMEFESVRFLRFVFGAVVVCIGGAAGIKYYVTTGGLIGGVIGAIVGWNIPDLFKGRPQK
jgi:uncharacterized membrane protein